MPFPQRIGPTELGTSIATIFTANRPVRLTFLSLSNRTAATRTVTIHVVPSGSTAVDANKIVPAVPIPLNDLRSFPMEIPMFAGDAIRGFADAAGVIFVGAYSDEKKPA